MRLSAYQTSSYCRRPVQRHQRNYNPDSGKITKRWFTCYDDDPDDPTDAHWHAQVYEQGGKIIQVSIYGEG